MKWPGMGTLCAMVAFAVGGAPIQAQGGPPPEERAAIDAFLGTLMSEGEALISDYVEEHLTAEYRAALGDRAIGHFAGIREGTRGRIGDIGVEMTPSGLRLMLSGPEGAAHVLIRFDRDYRLEHAELEESGEREVSTFDNAVEFRIQALESLGALDREAFISENISPSLTARLGRGELDARLNRIARAAAAAMAVELRQEPEGYLLGLREGNPAVDVRFSLAPEPPFLIDRLELSDPPARTVEPMELTWERLEEQLDAVARGGIHGTVLAVRDGEVVLHRGWGESNPRTGRPNDVETLFAVGSLPIDFTRAAVLLLEQEGRLDLDDPISEYLDRVPTDKRGMTLEHLFSGRSGLPNFHHRPGDADADLTWIDRAEAERRLMESPLLFEPGSASSPSHSAFVLLAAIVERVSGASYDDFLRTRFFEPLGMRNTGPFGTDLGVPLERFAVGEGPSVVGDPNIGPNWGRTSWLIMGSGGMVSSPADYHRWFSGLQSGRILEGEALERYFDRGGVLGGSDRGFFVMHAWAGGDDMIVAFFNRGTEHPDMRPLTAGILSLVASDPGAR